MLKLRHLIALGASASLLTATAGNFAQAQPTPPPDYYPLPTGAYWNYKTTTSMGNESEFTMTVCGPDEQADGSTLTKVEVFSTLAFYSWYSKPSGWVKMHREASAPDSQFAYDGWYEPVKDHLKNPLGVGDTWSWEGKRPGMIATDLTETNTVEAVEEVTVPAGTFSAVKVITEGDQGGSTFKRTYWYANRVGFVKGIVEANNGQFSSTSELIERGSDRACKS